MQNDNVIIWQKWFDPFGMDDMDTDDNPMDDPQFLDEESISSSGSGSSETISSSTNIGYIKVIATPMGIIPVNENTLSSKIFNFWIGHTNFTITKNIADILESVEGVETLDIFTRYRFRIAIGKAFNDSQVMRNINNIIYKELSNV